MAGDALRDKITSKLEAQLLRAQRMESIGRLAGGVAHDFNNFLTAVEGYTDLALAELPDDSPGRRDLLEARRSTERAANLTRQLLLFSRREAINLKPISLNEVISNLLKMLGRIIGEQCELLVDLDRGERPGTGATTYGGIPRLGGRDDKRLQPGGGSQDHQRKRLRLPAETIFTDPDAVNDEETTGAGLHKYAGVKGEQGLSRGQIHGAARRG